MRFADKIMKLRSEQGVSQKDLAKAMGVSRQTVYKWEADLSVPEIDKIKAISQFFGVSCEELLNDDISLPDKKENESTCNTFKQKENVINKEKSIKFLSKFQLAIKKNNFKLLTCIFIAILFVVCMVILVIRCALNFDNAYTDTDVNSDVDITTNDKECTHLYKLTKVIVEETCVSDGEKEIECSNCGYKKKIILPRNKHIYVDDECVVCKKLNISEGIIYEIDEKTKTAYVKSKGTCTDNRIVIAKEYNGYNVTKIGEEAFMYANIQSVKIPDSVTEIEDKAFFFCSELTKIDFGDSVKIIGEYSFYHCGDFAQIIFPDSIETIGRNAFSLTKINYVLMGKNIKKIDHQAFLDCKITFFKFRERGTWKIYGTTSNTEEIIEIFPDENRSEDVNQSSSYGIWMQVE